MNHGGLINFIQSKLFVHVFTQKKEGKLRNVFFFYQIVFLIGKILKIALNLQE